jgi:beta-1,2-mannobiose phosphorylase / 1,2-beta-oligomannan phosphorylase
MSIRSTDDSAPGLGNPPGLLNRRTFIGCLLTAPFLPLCLSGCSEGETAGGWVLDPHNPVLGGALMVCFDPFVLKQGDLYKMWFSWRTKHGIGYTESHNGYQWSMPRIVLTPDPAVTGQIEVNRSSVLLRDGLYRLWYTGQSAEHSQIYCATSLDGLVWRRSSQPVLASALDWEKSAVMAPDVIWDDEKNEFRMYYSAGEQYEPDCIALATSADGLAWTKREQPILTADPNSQWEQAKVTGADVHKVDGWHYMFYIGFADMHHANIGLARSRDGISRWQKHPANPIVRPPGGLNVFAWNRDAIYKPSAIREEDKWVLFFNARRRDVEQIGVALHRGVDLGF